MPRSHALFTLTAGLTLSATVSASDGPTLQARLDELAESLEAAREKAHLPGMSIAIVKDDEVVWARGFGFADLAAERPADEETIYRIGSTTKAFTSALVAMLVDEGKASWDDPVTRFLPYFDLDVRSEDEKAECSLRDLLSHRHGFSRMGVLFLSGRVSREDVLRTAAKAEPLDDFRAGFHYSNISYLAAGQAVGAAAGRTWEELMVERIFEPLEMTSSTVSVDEVRQDPRLALGYKWNEEGEQLERAQLVDLDVIGPAGSVNSNVLDMAQWLRLQLGRGEVDGKRLISTESVHETWSPQIAMGPDASYGLGWMLRGHDGHEVVEHGGNVDGFSTQIGMIPEEQLGYVLLMNLNAAALRQPSLPLIFDALLDALQDELPDDRNLAEAEEINLEVYVGIYVANFANFRDADFEVLVRDQRLALAIPGQQTSDLLAPDAEGRWE
jgi:CubicO group peptidase (beta-lactamase class C family)